MTRRGMQGLSGLVERTMAELFPGQVNLGGQVWYECACSGGRVFREFDEWGKPVVHRVFVIRILKEFVAEDELPAIGAKVSWQPEGEAVRKGRVREKPDRPHEVAWALEVSEQ